ncbi:LysM peptidoglycan-binding domain-containing protein [Salinibacillus xinjiangensis]|uniref:LysM peptidoglycan-binding domain-containing protein n=1 Tax=Salinibacillus xinjiangensis TaxID=1229268 RepID=A0A6G1XAJ9_9BACI|nr:glycoside hydrolase family 18 protein [Salinibacillus xinjiangensis]MRG87926.1 LysM peptidoglycan-binding domain-containing protein [Salinibacillus xinjiangensis]
MIIYVVKAGESLFDIAQRFQVPMDQIINLNELDQPSQLVVGQALVIPSNQYRVQPGESLYVIGQKFNIPYQQLAEANQIPLDGTLQIGQTITLPQQPKVSKEFNAYVEPTGGEVSPELEQSARSKAQYLTYLAPFSYQINRDGTLVPPPLNQFPQIASDNGALLMMVLTNLEEGEFSDELGRIIVTDENFQDQFLSNVIETANNVGFGDIHFDFEFLPPEVREDYNNFLRKAKQRLSEAGLLLSTALAPKTSAEQEGAWYTAHDYAAHGEIVDFVVLMTYEWGYSGGPAMAVSPIGPVRDVVEYALSVMPSEKIFLGQNLYGYDWTLPYEPGGDYAEALSPQAAIQRARENNTEIQFDEEAQAPFYFYNDQEGNRHEVWFEDARSIQAKFDLVKELNLRGISYWKLGLAFPQNWVLLDNQFNVVKR